MKKKGKYQNAIVAKLLLCALRDGGVVTRGQIAAAVCTVAAR